jgi:hypothetical protein
MRVWVDLTNSPHVPAGGTMNSEAVALGTPVLREGRLRRLTDPDDVRVERRTEHGGLRVRRDPRELVTLLLSAIPS